MAIDKQPVNPTDDQRTTTETGIELSERDLKQVVGGAIDSYMQFLDSTATQSEPEEKP